MKTRHPPERWLALAILACTLSACAGHSDVDETSAPPSVPATLHCAPEPAAGNVAGATAPALPAACTSARESLS